MGIVEKLLVGLIIISAGFHAGCLLYSRHWVRCAITISFNLRDSSTGSSPSLRYLEVKGKTPPHL